MFLRNFDKSCQNFFDEVVFMQFHFGAAKRDKNYFGIKRLRKTAEKISAGECIFEPISLHIECRFNKSSLFSLILFTGQFRGQKP